MPSVRCVPLLAPCRCVPHASLFLFHFVCSPLQLSPPNDRVEGCVAVGAPCGSAHYCYRLAMMCCALLLPAAAALAAGCTVILKASVCVCACVLY